MRTLQRPGRYLLLFDLDGTLYPIRGGSYRRSPLRTAVRTNACQFLVKRLRVSRAQAQRILRNIERAYGEDISIGLERSYGIDRSDYFNTVWDIPARGIVPRAPHTRSILRELQRSFTLALVSDAPRVWVMNVLRALRVREVFGGRVFTGEGNRRKGFENALLHVARKLKVHPRYCVVVGDQEATDIIPAHAAGMRTILVSRRCRRTSADACIRNLNELESALAHVTGAARV